MTLIVYFIHDEKLRFPNNNTNVRKGTTIYRCRIPVPKPLITVDGRPMISHVVDPFPGEQCVTFICQESHLNDPSKMEEQLLDCCSTAKIISIPEHKLGPVHAVLSAAKTIDQNKQTIVNYCDFSCYWDWDNFKHFVSADI